MRFSQTRDREIASAGSLFGLSSNLSVRAVRMAVWLSSFALALASWQWQRGHTKTNQQYQFTRSTRNPSYASIACRLALLVVGTVQCLTQWVVPCDVRPSTALDFNRCSCLQATRAYAVKIGAAGSGAAACDGRIAMKIGSSSLMVFSGRNE